MMILRFKKLEIWIWYWGKEEFPFTEALIIKNSDYTAELKLHEDRFETNERSRKVSTDLSLKISLNFEDIKLVNGLKATDKTSYEYAKQKIENLVNEIMNTFLLKSKMICRLDSLDFQTTFHSSNIFRDLFGFDNLEWSLDGITYSIFSKINTKNRKINPRYKRENLFDSKKWRKLIDKFNTQTLPPAEIIELYKIRDKLFFNDLRIATIETITIIETFLYNKFLLVSSKKGISQKTLTSMKKDITFSILLNILLPMSITPKEINIYGTDIKNIDNLRRIRNKIMHENLGNDKIEKLQTKRAVESGIKLLKFLDKKFR